LLPIQNRKSPEEHVDARRQGRTVLVVEFTLAGQRFMALNGARDSNTPMRSRSRSTAPIRPRSIAVGRAVRQWRAVERCGWLKDRFGVSWQIVPTALVQYWRPIPPAPGGPCRR